MKVLHVLETSVPDMAGYTVRAREIIEHQRRIGLQVVVVTSPLFPAQYAGASVEAMDGVRYYRTNHIRPPSSAKSKLGSYAYRLLMLYRYRQAVEKVVRTERPDVIHAHSSYGNAHAAIPSARRFDLPLVYEVRTLWGESAVVEDGLQTQSWQYRMIWRLELAAMKRADAVVPISRGIYDELVSRGIDAGKMMVVPNGVDLTRFTPAPLDESRSRQYGLDGKFVVGFIGSMRRLEGLSTLIEAYAHSRAVRDNIRLVLVGDGPDRPNLQSLASKLGLADVVFAGNVANQDVESWYSVMNVLAYPRIRALINERVTPLKPLEAMALGKVCVGSDVGGLKELISHDRTGMIFPSGNAQELARVLVGLADDRARRERLAAEALSFVHRERDWRVIIPRTKALYEDLVQSRCRTSRALDR